MRKFQSVAYAGDSCVPNFQTFGHVRGQSSMSKPISTSESQAMRFMPRKYDVWETNAGKHPTQPSTARRDSNQTLMIDTAIMSAELRARSHWIGPRPGAVGVCLAPAQAIAQATRIAQATHGRLRPCVRIRVFGPGQIDNPADGLTSAPRHGKRIRTPRWRPPPPRPSSYWYWRAAVVRFAA